MKKFAIIFSGQGLYNPNILFLLLKKYPIIKRTFQEASDFLKYDILKKILQEYYPNKKNQLEFQYFILISSVAMFRMWLQQSSDLFPNIMAGHSIGQYSALICNHSIKFIDGLKILKIRDKIIKSKKKNKKYLTYVIIGLKLPIIKKICLYVSGYKKKVFVSCINTDIQTVITGHSLAVIKANKICKKHGAKHIIKLPIYFSMHCLLMKKISKIFSYHLNKIKILSGQCSIIENVKASFLLSKEEIYQAIIKQFYKPVKWTKIIKKIISSQIKYCININLNNTFRNSYLSTKKLINLSINSKDYLLSTIDIIKNNEKKK